MRSSAERGGLLPISAKKPSNASQRSQTLMPRPPYRAKLLLFGLPQRASIAHHTLYSTQGFLPRVAPCVVLILAVTSARLHPQLCVWPADNAQLTTLRSVPHSHLHLQNVPPLPRCDFSITRQRPKI